MSQLELVEGDEQWTKLRKRALADFYFFCEVILGLGPLIPMRPNVHLAFCRFIAKQTGVPELDDAFVHLALMPRETGKTALATKAYPMWRLCQDPNRAFILANEKEENASEFLGSIEKMFETNMLLRTLFPEIIPGDLNKVKWSATKMDLERSTNRQENSVRVTGVGGSVTGMHPDEVLCDDILSLEAMRNAKVGARQVIAGVNDWVKTLRFLVNKNATQHGINIVGTHWFHDDCYDFAMTHFGAGEPKKTFRLRFTAPDGTVVHAEAYRQGEIAVMIRSAVEDGRSIFPEKWDLEQLARMRMADPKLFAANMMNNPSDDITSDFKEEWLKTFDTVEEGIQLIDQNAKTRTLPLVDLDRIIMVDPGGFGVIQGSDRARAAIILTGSTPDGLHCLLRCWSEKDTYLNAIKQIVQWAGQYRPRKIVVEQTAQQAAFLELLRRELSTAGVQVTVEPITPRSKAKEARILELEPFFQQGRLYIGRGPEFLEFRQQYSQFPNAVRRDILDVLAYGPHVWRKTALSALSHTQRQQQELAAYMSRRSGTMTYGR